MASHCPHIALLSTTVGASSVATKASAGMVADRG